MLFRTCLFVTALAPALPIVLAAGPAAAFGNLDCITTQSCGAGGCLPVTTPFAVTFDWAADAVTVDVDGRTQSLPWSATGESDDGLASILDYGDIDEGAALRIAASGLDITALYSFREVGVVTWDATCNLRTAT
ncbi:hypothetical protein [Pseudooctadecabacter jejudonensis]|uniref:Uncharacterized protein n=1 Tax=Pseudooctadecabacter jejudonensis TaxID=1391910 RepID=A0A1Y5RK05_9RHOB|nr:hypothetical protein [Pseudooctadecabacter jejudonensis]SLN19353.1 hypothetical protein PSJ8397_00677 [Pseudooctadecabacter jejudonensis]